MLTKREALELTAAIQQGVAAVPQAFGGLIWRVLGFASWPDYCNQEIGGEFKVDANDRRRVVGKLRRDGLTQQAIADELGVNVSTVNRDMEQILQMQNLPDADSTALPETILTSDGKKRTSRNGHRGAKYEQAKPRVETYLVDHPHATRNGTAAALGVDRSMVSRIAQEIGHTWTRQGPPREATRKGGRDRHKPKVTPPPPLSDPSHVLAYESKQVLHMLRMCSAMASDNGRMHYAQHLIGAMHERDEAWVEEQRQALEYVLAYLGDFLRCHIDQEFRNRLNTGWEGRDDIADQQVTSRRLRAVQ